MTTLKDLITERYGVEADCGADMPAEGPLALILGRGSQRHYTTEPLPAWSNASIKTRLEPNR